MKKQFFSIALLAALLGTPLAQAKTAIPYTQDFESETSWPVAGWTSVGSGNKKPYTNAAQAHSGSKSLIFGSSTSNIAIMPQFTSEIAELQLEVWWKPKSFDDRCGYFDFGYITDTTNAASFVAVKTVYFADYGAVYHKERLYFTSAPAGARIAFRARPNSGSFNWFIDDITVKVLPTCYPVSDFAVADVTTNSADITWTASGHSETQWQYVCDTVGFTPDWSKATLVSSNTASISGLNPNTDYEIYVRSYCSEADQSDPENFTFRTACVPVTPASLGIVSFEAAEGFVTGAGNMTNCWTVGNMQSANSDYIPYVEKNTTNAHTGSNCLRIKAENYYSTYADSAYAVMPEIIFNGGISSYEIHFYMRKETASASNGDLLYVGIVSDPADLSDLQIIGTCVNNTATYTQQIVSFANYVADTTGYVVFLASLIDPTEFVATTSFYVDDIEIIKSRLTTTPVVDSVVNITTTTADVHFSGSNATSYRIMLATEAVSDPETYTNWAIDTVVTASPATINVQSSTTYYLYMQGIGQDSSFISTPAVIFDSECKAVTTFPWKEDFNDMTAGNFSKVCWTNEHISGSGAKIANISTFELYYNTTPQLHFDDQNAGTRTHVLTPEFDIPTADTYFFSIDAYREGRNSYPDEGIRVIIDKGAGKDTTFIPVDTASAGDVGTVSSPGWYTYTIKLPNSGIQQIEILDIAVNGYGMSMDNFRVYNLYDSVTVVANALVNGTGTVEGSGKYLRGDEVTLTATPAEGYTFKAWSNGETANPYSFVVTSDTTLTANFEEPGGTATFTITFTGNCVPTSDEKVFIAGNFDDTPSWERVYQMDKTGEATWTYPDLAYPANFKFQFVIQYFNNPGEVSEEIWNPTDNIVFDNMTFDFELEAGCPTPSPEPYDTLDYLHFVALNDGDTVRLDKKGTPDAINLQYSKDKQSWTDYSWTETTGASIAFNQNDTVWFRAGGTGKNAVFSKDGTNYYNFVFGTNDSIAAGGNVMSLYDATLEQDTMTNSGFYKLFYGCSALVSAPELPAQTLAKACYFSMFRGCTSLTTAPTLSPLTMAQNCCISMFSGCTSLYVDTLGASCNGVEMSFPETATAQNWSMSMFQGCHGNSQCTAQYGIIPGKSYCVSAYIPRQVTVLINDSARGSVTGAGEYQDGTTATLTATPNAHYEFVQWSNGSVDNTINVTVTGDITLTAFFARDEHTITVNSNNPTMGSVSGGSIYTHDDTATITATANANYKFVNWSNGETANPYSFVVTADTTLTANFEANSITGITTTPYKNMYDGSAHNITVSGTLASDVVSYSTDSANWSASLSQIDVCAQKVFVKVARDNYFDYITTDSIVITKRSVTMTSATDTKKYDGSPLTNSNVSVTGDGFVAGEGATYNVTGSQTVVGSSKNTFTYTLTNGTKAANYDIDTIYGTLTVIGTIKPVIVGMYDKWNIMLNVNAFTDTLEQYINGVVLLPENVKWYIANGAADEVDANTGAVVDDQVAQPATGFFHTEDKAMVGSYYCVVYVPEAQNIIGVSYFQSNVLWVESNAPARNDVLKYIQNGQMIIENNGVQYNAQGQILK